MIRMVPIWKDVTCQVMNITHLDRPFIPDRYLLNFNTDSLPQFQYDAIIIGSGIAGVYTALSMSSSTRILIMTKEAIDMNNSVLAQGGIAVSLDKKDSPDLHFQDTAYAGAGLCDENTVRTLVNEASENIAQLCLYGVNFDRGIDRQLSLTREAAHSRNRIIHTGDATGKEVCDALVSAVRVKDNVEIREEMFAVDILTVKDVCRGVLAMNKEGELQVFSAPVVICASGGYGRLYANTTNPEVATGDGASMAYRAGAHLMDLEFIQFHPTALFHNIEKNFLISEAVRGEGAVLRNLSGERFMPGYHELAELAPRDVVSRAIFAEMQKTGSDHVFLDITHKDRAHLEKRFPTIFGKCLSFGIDISKDYIPVAPSQHYSMGGIKTDEWGRTGLPGFYAVGEAACNGIHGANRLASNSLLEGLVFGRRIAKAISEKFSEAKNDDNAPSSMQVFAEQALGIHSTIKMSAEKMGEIHSTPKSNAEKVIDSASSLSADEAQTMDIDSTSKTGTKDEVRSDSKMIVKASDEKKDNHLRHGITNYEFEENGILSVEFRMERQKKDIQVEEEIAKLQSLMTNDVGIIRCKDSLERAITTINTMSKQQEKMLCETIEEMELRNMTLLSSLVAKAALYRTESRGAHYRSDYPFTEETWHMNVVI